MLIKEPSYLEFMFMLSCIGQGPIMVYLYMQLWE